MKININLTEKEQIIRAIRENPGIMARELKTLLPHIEHQAIVNAERRGRRHRGGYGAHDEPCTYWLVGDYIITYCTDDLNFSAEMLFDDMMDELIIEEG